MAIHLYNSLTKKKEELIPIKDKVINMYSCGVTVYDKCHIGHARSLYIFTVITRYLRSRGYQVNFVRNITDIDDKIINRANELKKSWVEVAEENIDKYHDDLKRLKIDVADKEPRATENIPGMIKHIQGLIDKGFAYESDGDVYFDVRKFDQYGQLSGQSVEKMLEGVRIDPVSKKKDHLDFALWKKSKEGEPAWESPWGEGRPGWHIECSVMSLNELNCQTLDIHAGGHDLIFPHHENEIAQSEALTGQPFARNWIHHGLLTINGQKMAKSLGNFITVEDAVKKYPLEDLKLFFLMSHYSSHIDFSDEKMKEIHRSRERFNIFFAEAERLGDLSSEVPAEKTAFVKEYENKFFEAMDDDFNTSRACGILFELINEVYKRKADEDYGKILSSAVAVIHEKGREIFGIFSAEESLDISQEVEKLIEERKQARLDKDFKRSDEIRDGLEAMGIIIEDTKEGQRWRKG